MHVKHYRFTKIHDGGTHGYRLIEKYGQSFHHEEGSSLIYRDDILNCRFLGEVLCSSSCNDDSNILPLSLLLDCLSKGTEKFNNQQLAISISYQYH